MRSVSEMVVKRTRRDKIDVKRYKCRKGEHIYIDGEGVVWILKEK